MKQKIIRYVEENPDASARCLVNEFGIKIGHAGSLLTYAKRHLADRKAVKDGRFFQEVFFLATKQAFLRRSYL